MSTRLHKPRLALIFTGGTISMTQSRAKGGAVPTLTGADICQAVPGLEQRFEISCIDFGKLPGPHMTLDRMLELHSRVREAFAAGADGVVITHGTDTLEETAYLLDLLHDDTRPIVVVGAMRASDDLSWDGPVNLFSACLVAGSREAHGRGVLVAMNNTINAASEVSKTYTEAVHTFVSPDMGPLGIIDMERVLFYRGPARRSQVQGFTGSPSPVELVVATSGSDRKLIDAAVQAGSKGLVVAAMGRGNVPPPMASGLYDAMHASVRVVVCSRCWGGRVAPAYGYEGGGAELLAGGALFAPWLNPAKARLALSLALAANYDIPALMTLFDSPAPPARPAPH